MVLPLQISGVSQYLTSAEFYYGFSLRETAGAAAVVRIRAAGATGLILDTISLSAGESTREFYPEPEFSDGGIYVEIVSGTIEGSVRSSF